MTGGSATKEYFYENGDGRPTEAEVCLLSVLMTETSGASIEPEVLQIWVNSMVAFSGGNYFDPNWAPSDDYNTNSRCKHPVVAQGLEFLVLRHAERTKAAHRALADNEHSLTNGETKYYLERLTVGGRKVANKKEPLTTNGKPRIKYVLTEAAYFLHPDSNIATMVRRLGLAHGQVPLGQKEISAKKGVYKKESFEKGKELEEMKLGVENLTAEFKIIIHSASALPTYNEFFEWIFDPNTLVNHFPSPPGKGCDQRR